VDISFIIVSWNTRDLLVDCLNSIEKHAKGYSFETFVVDNNSSDGSSALVEKLFHNRVNLIRNSENMGFGRANNQAIKYAKGRYVILLNSDTVLNEGTVSGLVSFLDNHGDAAMSGPRMTDENGKPQNSYDNFPALITELLNKSILRKLFPEKFAGKSLKKKLPFEVDSLIGACIAIRSEAIKEVGMFDEDYFFFLEETDWCFRMRKAGWKIFHQPEINIIHLQGQSKKIRPVLSWIEYYRSLYKYFKKNRSRASYLCLRIFRFFKLVINLVLTFIGLLFTLGKKKRLREKTVIYSRILWWHLTLCPEHVGLKGKG
jgi:GT2 family glycosyltransferase